MEKVICFGAAGGAKRLYSDISQKYQIIAFTDNDSQKWGGRINEIPILSPSECFFKDFDAVIITSAPGLESIKKQCLELGIPERKIVTSFVEAPLDSRRIFLQQLALLQNNLPIAAEVAEVGVFEGDFAKWINQYYPNRIVSSFFRKFNFAV